MTPRPASRAGQRTSPALRRTGGLALKQATNAVGTTFYERQERWRGAKRLLSQVGPFRPHPAPRRPAPAGFGAWTSARNTIESGRRSMRFALVGATWWLARTRRLP